MSYKVMGNELFLAFIGSAVMIPAAIESPIFVLLLAPAVYIFAHGCYERIRYLVKPKSKQGWAIWFDPEDSSNTLAHVDSKHYGSDKSYELGRFSTKARAADEHFDKAKKIYDQVLGFK